MSNHVAVRLAEIRETPLSIDEVFASVGDPASGAVTLFVGRVRNHHDGNAVAQLEYSAHPSAQSVLAQVCAEIAVEYDAAALGAVHRAGALKIGDLAVITAVATAHRGAGFQACQALIDRIKDRVPIWKHEGLLDGREVWVGVDIETVSLDG